MNEKISTENQIEEIEAHATALPERYRGLTIRNDTENKGARDSLIYVKGLLARANGVFDPIIQDAHKAHRTALDKKKEVVDPILEAERLIKRAVGDYHTELERSRQEAEETVRKAQEEHKRKEEERLQAAITAEEKGDQEEVERILDEGLKIEITPALVPEIPKMAGVSVRDNWKFEVMDKTRIPIEFMIVDEAKIGKIVRAAKKDAEKMIPGIKVWAEKSVSARAG